MADKADKFPSSARQNRGIVVVAREFLTKYMVAMVTLPPETAVLEMCVWQAWQAADLNLRPL